MSNFIFSLTNAGGGPKISFRDASAILDSRMFVKPCGLSLLPLHLFPEVTSNP